jgi:hypothetical protein
MTILRRCVSLLFLLFVFLFTERLHAQISPPPAAVADTGFHPTMKPTMKVYRREGAITIDGDLSDPGWRTAAHTSEFTCALPIPNSCPKVKTEVFVTYDDEYLYVAMIAHDDHPEQIRSSMIGRDNMFDDDFMGMILDTYGDATKAFEIYVNPRSCQGDLFWTANNEDASYDLIYDAESKITPTGWQCEFRIPFRSLRFPNVDVQNFHVAFWRNYPRETVYKFSSSPINFYQPCAFCQMGALTGVEHIKPAGSLELLPALVASQSANVPDFTVPNPKLINDPVEVKPSLGLRYAVGPATSLEATIVPDFSQVEADAAQVDVNTTFALYYPEHRPFFQDGSDLFSTYLNAVYTRSINSPLAAAKVLHRDATTNYAFISGYDQHSPIIIPLEESSVVIPDAGNSLSNIFRATHSLGDDTYIGFIGTDRRYANNGSNSVAGFDGRVRLYENIALYGQALWSYTKEQNTPLVATTIDSATATERFTNGQHTVEFDGEHYVGNMSYFAIERFTPGPDVHFEYGQSSPDFRAGNGFVFNNDVRVASGWAGYKFPLQSPPAWLKWLIEVDGSLTGTENWNFDGQIKLLSARPRIDIGLTGESDLHISYRPFTQRFHDTTFSRLHQFDILWDTHFIPSISLNGEVTVGREIAVNAQPVAVGNEVDISCNGKLRPFDGFLIEPSYIFSQLGRDGGGYFYSGSIYRSRFTYQFSRQFFVRVIVQYDGFQKQLLVDPLLTYQINPFTSFYIGSTHEYASIDMTNDLRPTSRQFFAKLQYLIQT